MDQSQAAFSQAAGVLVGGVNSPVRAFRAVGGEPLFIARAAGAKIFDLDGNEYIDYVGGYGPAILGHAHPAVTEAVAEAVRGGMSFGAPTERETALAEQIVGAFGSVGLVEKVRFTGSGTEAVMTAIRLARGATGRAKILKFVGGYHGHADALLVQAGSGATTLGAPSSAGVPAAATADTLLASYNDLGACEALAGKHGDDLAAVLVEPVAGNMGVIPPADGFLEGLRTLCDRCGALLIFDEVMTGFRLARGGAQGLFGVRADLTTLGKVIGGGLPVGAVAGPADIMDHLAPLGAVYQAGTLSGNPAAMAAGLATLETIAADTEFYANLEKSSAALEKGLCEAASRAGMGEKIRLQRVGSMLCCFFTPGPVRNHAEATACQTDAFARYFHAMLAEGVYPPPSQFEAMFISAAHTPENLAATVRAAERAFAAAGQTE
jgi:glutamate-1-semialdehyde 2,1-aminomutase